MSSRGSRARARRPGAPADAGARAGVGRDPLLRDGRGGGSARGPRLGRARWTRLVGRRRARRQTAGRVPSGDLAAGEGVELIGPAVIVAAGDVDLDGLTGRAETAQEGETGQRASSSTVSTRSPWRCRTGGRSNAGPNERPRGRPTVPRSARLQRVGAQVALHHQVRASARTSSRGIHCNSRACSPCLPTRIGGLRPDGVEPDVVGNLVRRTALHPASCSRRALRADEVERPLVHVDGPHGRLR